MVSDSWEMTQLAKRCTDLPGLAGNNNGGSDKCIFEYMHAF